jgi:hypothetical protein
MIMKFIESSFIKSMIAIPRYYSLIGGLGTGMRRAGCLAGPRDAA